MAAQVVPRENENSVEEAGGGNGNGLGRPANPPRQVRPFGSGKPARSEQRRGLETEATQATAIAAMSMIVKPAARWRIE